MQYLWNLYSELTDFILVRNYICRRLLTRGNLFPGQHFIEDVHHTIMMTATYIIVLFCILSLFIQCSSSKEIANGLYLPFYF